MKSRKVYRFVGYGPETNLGVHDSCVDNLERGIFERIFTVKGKAPLQTTGAIVKERLGTFTRRVKHLLPHSNPLSIQAFLETYDTARLRNRYSAASVQYLSRGVDRLNARVKSFVKAEKINFTEKEDPAPRIINPREYVYNLAVGIYIKAIEKEVYKAIARVFREVTVAKGLNALECGRLVEKKWSKYSDPVAVGLDASRFDQHCRVPILRWEHGVYLSAFRGEHHQELSKLLSYQLRNGGRSFTADGNVAWEVDGCRMSGDMNTGLGNCLIMCALVWTYARSVGVKCSLLNNGDDCVVILERTDLTRFTTELQTWFAEMGYEMKVEDPVDEIEKIVFCQTQPVWTPQGYTMVRQYGVSFAKDLTSLKDITTQGGFDKYRNLVSQCGLAAYRNIPVHSAFYESLGRGTNEIPNESIDGGLRWLASRMDSPVGVADGTRFSYWRAFGVDPSQQLAIESWLDGMNPAFHKPVLQEDWSYSEAWGLG